MSENIHMLLKRVALELGFVDLGQTKYAVGAYFEHSETGIVIFEEVGAIRPGREEYAIAMCVNFHETPYALAENGFAILTEDNLRDWLDKVLSTSNKEGKQNDVP